MKDRPCKTYVAHFLARDHGTLHEFIRELFAFSLTEARRMAKEVAAKRRCRVADVYEKEEPDAPPSNLPPTSPDLTVGSGER